MADQLAVEQLDAGARRNATSRLELLAQRRPELFENADKLEALAKARKKGTVDVVKIPGVNHLLVAAQTGEVDEYGRLGDAVVSRDVSGAIAGWLQKTMTSGR